MTLWSMKNKLTLIVLLLLGAVTASRAQDYRGEGIGKVWEYRLDGNLTTTTFTPSDTYDQSMGVDFTLAYNINNYFSGGFSTGLMHDFGRAKGYKRGDVIPVLGDVQYRWNFYRTSVFVEGRGGLLWGDLSHSQRTNRRYASYTMYEIQPGFILKVNTKIDIRLSLGYAHAHDFVHNEFDENYLILKLGFARRFKRIIL